MNRRTVVRAAAWTAPAITVAVAAPAYATSPPLACEVEGERKNSTYSVKPACGTATVTEVWIDGYPATLGKKGEWSATLSDNRPTRTVRIVTDQGEWSGSVTFS